jgi:hypothetical protein
MTEASKKKCTTTFGQSTLTLDKRNHGYQKLPSTEKFSLTNRHY